MKILRTFIIAAIVLVSCAPRSFAMVYLPEEKVISSVVISEDQYLSPGTVTVIRPDDFKGESLSLAEILSRVPGVSIVKGAGGSNMPMIRGAHQRETATYVDGISYALTEDLMYPNALEWIPIDQIERIEVYKGFVPARFGNEAMGGVINIVTKMPTEPETRLSLGVGSYGRLTTTASHSLPLGGGSLFGSIGFESYNGNFKYWHDNSTRTDPTDDYTEKRSSIARQNVDLMLKWNDEHWRARFAYNRRLQDFYNDSAPLYRPAPIEAPGRPNLLDWTRWDVSLGRTQTYGSLKWGWDISYSDAASDVESFPYNPNNNNTDLLFKRTALALHGEMPIGERQMVSAVGEYINEKYTQRTDTEVQLKLNLEELNFNLQDEIIIDEKGTLLFTPSLRYSKIGGEGKTTWQIALSKELSNGLMFKTAYGTYARVPTLYERLGDQANWIAPNPDLKPETGKQFDAGVTWNGTVAPLGNARVNTSLSGYLRESDNLIDYVAVGYENVWKAKIKGLEFATALDWERWNFALSAAYTDSETITPNDPATNGRRRRYLPEWDMTARLTHRFNRGSVFAEYQYVGDYFVGGRYDGSTYPYVESSNVFNLGLKYDISDMVGLTVGVNDVFDEMNGLRVYDEADSSYAGTPSYPWEGRTFYVTLDARF
ncbi:MAG: TonB-dependent receptor [Synergistaceae bacterium]|jgi:outer membrane cobalamin receptor|nr:TonB-dependent receptor [Synergistaceae bacterium]